MNRSVELEDNNTLGVHIISFDDTVNNTIQSENLINGETSTRPTTVVTKKINPKKFYKSKNKTFVKVSRGSTDVPSSTNSTEKQMSIIERIINSITSISTTTPLPDTVTKTTTQTEPTRASAILKLATRKTPELTSQKIQTLTTEKPTTIIERILTSLSAIQAETTTVKPKNTQVGNNFNSISTTTFKPSSTKRSVTSSTLSAQVSSTLDPVSLLEQIKADQTLQKRTIEKLLILLNTVNDDPTTPKTILVTPKITTFLQSTQPLSEESTTKSPQGTVVESTTIKAVEGTARTPQSTMKIPDSTTKIAEATTTVATTSTDPKDDAEEFVPTTIPVVSTRIQDMLNVLTKLIRDMNRSTTTTTESGDVSTMDPRMLNDRIGEINTETIPTVTSDAMTMPTPTISPNSEVNDLLAPQVNNTNTSSTNTNTASTPLMTTPQTTTISSQTITINSKNSSINTTTPKANPTTSTANSTVTTVNSQTTTANSKILPTNPQTIQTNPQTSKNFVSVTTPFVATAIRYTTTPIITENDISVPETSTIVPEMTIETTLSPSTLPTIEKIDISPDKVSIYSANDIASTINDDLFGTTVSILARNFATALRNEMSTTPATTTTPKNDTNNTTEPVNNNTTEPMNNISDSMNITNGIMSNNTSEQTSNTTETVNNSTMSSNTTVDVNSNTIDQSNVNNKTISTNTTETNANVTTDTRTGKLLDIVPDPVENDIQSTPKPKEKDYFIFAILSNNTILRKKPSMYPTKETPFLIVGYYPNNTIIRKFPNGTLVPEEPVIQVSGFDTRDPIPPLPDITSNQVTQTQAEQADDNNNLQTVLNVNN